VAWVEADTCSFVFDVVGTGTRLLAGLRPGDPLDALGPLGTGFSVDAAAPRAVCVSGGVGCAPFPLLCAALRRSGVADIIVLNGAASASRLYPAERFQRGDSGIRVREATDDGGRGRRGRVTSLLEDALGDGAAVYACGPNPMLHALQQELARSPARPTLAEASLEAPMGCGFGTCLGCALPVLSDDENAAWALCCTDGPVMAMSRVDWTELALLPPANVA
jgi:dihydroorotate dehydrogenase electron transfer subunit